MTEQLRNAAQDEAVNKIEGQMILIACPGSGKTTTLLRRIHHMTADLGIDGGQILMVTFTRAAAVHMREQYSASYGASGGVTFSTIHALCNATLRKFQGITPDQILSESEIREFLRDQVRRNRSINDKEEFVTDFLTDLTVMRNNRIPAEQFLPKCTDDLRLYRSVRGSAAARREGPVISAEPISLHPGGRVSGHQFRAAGYSLRDRGSGRESGGRGGR